MVCLKLEDAPSYDTLWQIWVLKTRLKILNHWMLGLQFSREHQLSKTVEWAKVAQGPGLAGSRWHFLLLLRYSQNHVFVVDLFFHLEMPSSRNIISSTFVNLSRQEPTMSLVKTGLSQDLPDHEFCPFLSWNSHENYPGRLHIEWLCDCSVIVLRRSDFRKSFSIKLLLGELEKKHGMNRKLMTKTLRSISIPRQSH